MAHSARLSHGSQSAVGAGSERHERNPAHRRSPTFVALGNRHSARPPLASRQVLLARDYPRGHTIPGTAAARPVLRFVALAEYFSKNPLASVDRKSAGSNYLTKWLSILK